jgi:HEPN domain-containing protein
MPRADRRAGVAGDWVEKAESDLTAAVNLLNIAKRKPMDVVCFHAQQCVEKYLKALLAMQGIDFPKTHQIEEIIRLLPRGVDAGLSPQEQRMLTGYAVTTRYPGTYEAITMREARDALSMMRRVRRSVRRLLPRAAKTRRMA